MKWTASPYSEYDRYLFHQGTHYYSYTFMGGHLTEENGVKGARFAVWAPNAQRVAVVGDFNNWDGRRHPMQRISQGSACSSWVWEDLYKYRSDKGWRFPKADPSFDGKKPTPLPALRSHSYQWQDHEWQEKKAKRNHSRAHAHLRGCIWDRRRKMENT